MTLPDHFKTTAVRLAIRYLIIYAVVTAIAVGTFAGITGYYVNADIEAGLKADHASITAEYGKAGVDGARGEIERLIAANGSEARFFLLASAAGEDRR